MGAFNLMLLGVILIIYAIVASGLFLYVLSILNKENRNGGI